MGKSKSVSTLIRSGAGVRHANAAIAAEVYATLDATHGNSAQAASLRAILDRAAERYNAKMARIAKRQAAKAAAPVVTDEPKVSKPKVSKPKAAKMAKPVNGKAARSVDTARCGERIADGPACVRAASHDGEHYAV